MILNRTVANPTVAFGGNFESEWRVQTIQRMKVMNKLCYAVLAGVCLLCVSCDIDIGRGIRGDGNVVTEQRSIGPFSNIDASGAFRVEWSQGTPSAGVTTDENLQSYIVVTTEKNTLRLRTTGPIRVSHSLKVTLTSPTLEAAELSGASRLVAHQVNGARFYLDTTGAARINVDGKVDELVATMTGASSLSANSLLSKTAEISVTGAGKAYVTVSDSLKVSITGAGKVEYSGNPAHLERNITGAGSIRRSGGGPSAGPVVIGHTED